MSFFRKILLSCLLLTVMATTEAATVVVSSQPPVEKVIEIAPRGYHTCQILPAGFYHGRWYGRHRVCHYPRGGVWISGYWECLKFNRHSGICMNWEWIPSHWEKVVHANPQPQPQPVPVVVQPQPVLMQPAPVVQPVIQPVVQVTLGSPHHHHH